VLNLVYDELHRQAHRYLRRERAGHTLQTTALVNEVYLKLVKQENIAWESRSHFFWYRRQVDAAGFELITPDETPGQTRRREG